MEKSSSEWRVETSTTYKPMVIPIFPLNFITIKPLRIVVVNYYEGFCKSNYDFDAVFPQIQQFTHPE